MHRSPLADDLSAIKLPRWVKSARQVTDGRLVGLAEHHGCRLATLDAGIPKAVVIPQ